jgi:hypothetical protein
LEKGRRTVKRSTAVKWSLVSLAVLLVIACGLWLSGWWPNFDRSIELSDRFGNVENGSAYDRAAVDLGTAKKVVLPHDAVIRRGGEPGKMQFFMKKTMGFHGHPPKPMSIRDARKNMGCAVKVEGDDLLLATFGEWDSHIEGGTRMKLVAEVPEGIDVEQRKGLSGEDSVGREWHSEYLSKPKDAKGGYWYGPASPAEGWRAVPDVPDPDRQAR